MTRARKFLAVVALCPAAYLASCALFRTVLSDTQIACQTEVLASSIIPPGTPLQPVVSDVTMACGIADALIPDVQAIVAAYIAAQAEAGVSTAAAYVPSPMVLRARGLVVVPAGR